MKNEGIGGDVICIFGVFLHFLLLNCKEDERGDVDGENGKCRLELHYSIYNIFLE